MADLVQGNSHEIMRGSEYRAMIEAEIKGGVEGDRRIRARVVAWQQTEGFGIRGRDKIHGAGR